MGIEKIPTPEASKLEWGPKLGKMNWDQAEANLVDLISKLKE